MKRTLFFLAVAVLASGGASIVHASEPVLLPTVRFHAFDTAISRALGFASSSIVYFRELGAVTESELKQRQTYEKVGCHPLYVMQNGVTQESGYDCRSFFCVGYKKGPKVCEHRDGNAYGGVVEINRRLSLVTINDMRKNFIDHSAADRTDAMNEQINWLLQVKCKPFYLYNFDVAVGEGYTCEAFGQYPNYAPAITCLTDWRQGSTQTCNITLDEDPITQRRRLLNLPPASSSSSSSSTSTTSNSSIPSTTSFSDVIEGRYGYTAITTLAANGVLQGYGDGTFRPTVLVNRAEFLKMLLAGLHNQEVKDERYCFPDASSQWFVPFVCAAKRLGWVNGFPNGLFGPERTLKRAEGIKIIISSLGVPLDTTTELPPGVPDDQWYTPYIRTAMLYRIILEPSFDPGANATRADAAVWMYRAAKAMGRL